MRPIRIVGRLLIAATLAATASGCSGPGPGAGDARSAGLSPVAQVGKMLRVYRDGLKPPAKGAKDLPVYQKAPVPPPRGIKDLAPMARGFPLAVGSIRSGEVLLYWNTDLSDAADASGIVLAYAGEVPERGGEVLFRDGSTRRMTAEEFRAAKKPPGAKTEDEAAPAPKAKR